MAYAALVSLAQLLDQILHHHQSFYIPRSDQEQQLMESVQEKISFLQGFLDNYSLKAGETIQSLEAQIRDAVYQAQDIIEFHISDQVSGRRCFWQWLSTIRTGKPPNLLKVLAQIDSIVKEVIKMQITSYRIEEMQISNTSTLAPSSPVPNGRNKMVGFDEDLIEIKARLCGELSKLKIIPIVGMGGIGKTTFARNIFDDSLVAYHFDIRAWLSIFQEYNLRDILLGLLDSLPVIPEDLSKKSNEELMEHAYRILKGRRYLLIMDDIWSREAWDNLRRIFPDDNNGSRIVITTRLTDVAEYASSSSYHHMHFLSEDQSWNLLQEKVFVGQSCPPELEKIGRTVAKNCGGLPLAITVVAGILAKLHRTQHDWGNVAENISLAMATADERFSKILTLSYDHLPHHLKPCFLYMGRFPEDYEIPVSKLIKLWVAEGFLKPIGSKNLEEVAEEYLGDLVKRNLVLISKKCSNGKFRLCGMHDLLRDLCIRKAREEKFHDVYISRRDVAKRRLTIRHVSKIACASSPIRSILYLGGDEWGLFQFLLQLRLLRVLDIHNMELYCFPIEITELFHLRYLAFNYKLIVKPPMLPPSISKLHNLQTLIVYYFPCSRPLIPFQMGNFPQLRHLILTKGMLRIPLGARIGRHFPVLENLQTLCGIVNFKLTRKALDMIPNLRKLKLLYTCQSSKLHLNNLVHLHQLETLSLEFGLHIYPISYALPPNLKKLTLSKCRAPTNSMAIIGSLPNLEVLKLKNFAFGDGYWESNEGEFPRLKFLLIAQSNLVHWPAESSHFPRLEHLIIRACPDLAEIPAAIGDIATLDLIEVGPNSKSAAGSAVLIQEEQRSLGNDTLQFRIY